MITKPVLDLGFVQYIEHMGTDIVDQMDKRSIVEAARVSTGADWRGEEKDYKLLNYLYAHSHTTPFEMCEIKFHIKAPIFVARQWMRHRTANINEMSGRYRKLHREFYVPARWRMQNTEGNLQGSYVADWFNDTCEEDYIRTCNACFDTYQTMVEDGVANEMARMCLPLSTYTEWYWKIDLHNLLHFLVLRNDEHAQWEIKEYAKAVEDIVQEKWPYAYKVFYNRFRNANQ